MRQGGTDVRRVIAALVGHPAGQPPQRRFSQRLLVQLCAAESAEGMRDKQQGEQNQAEQQNFSQWWEGEVGHQLRVAGEPKLAPTDDSIEARTPEPGRWR